MKWIRLFVADVRELWRAMVAYYSPTAISGRIDDCTSRLLESRGLSPNPRVEQRRAKRRESA